MPILKAFGHCIDSTETAQNNSKVTSDRQKKTKAQKSNYEDEVG